MYVVKNLLGLDGLDGMVIWGILAFLLVVCAPLIFSYVMTGLSFISELISIIFYQFARPFIAIYERNLKSNYKINKTLTYKIKKEKRVFKQKNEDGSTNHPLDDEVVQKYKKLNENYPEIGSKEYKNARKLDMTYFLSEKYPYDYVVMGDRAQIEEARKGSRLTQEEEYLIWLGYGYDGKPFAEPWGLEEEFLNDYIYAQKQGDFLEWFPKDRKYDAYIAAGYEPPKDHYDGINKDQINTVEDRLKRYGRQVKRLDKTILKRYKNEETNVLSFNK